MAVESSRMPSDLRLCENDPLFENTGRILLPSSYVSNATRGSVLLSVEEGHRGQAHHHHGRAESAGRVAGDLDDSAVQGLHRAEVVHQGFRGLAFVLFLHVAELLQLKKEQMRISISDGFAI